jgi:hypothetical protein
MKHIKFKIIRSFIAPLFIGSMITFTAGAQTGNASASKIFTNVVVKETDAATAVLDFTVSNATAAPYLVIIRDSQGGVVFREWAKSDSYQKRFQMDLEESDSYLFEVVQNKKLVDTKTFTAKRRMEQHIEILAIK